MSLCEQLLVYLGMAAGTLFWVWYLLEEARYYKQRKQDRWYHKKLTDLRLFRRGDDA